MPTVVTKSIGTAGRDYSTLQTWDDAAPANLVTADQIWRGEVYNDSAFSGSTALLTIAGSTSDATRYKELTTAAGQSFRDNASVQTNPLRFDATKGASITSSVTYAETILIDEAYARVSKLQIANTAGNSHTLRTNKLNILAEFCVIEANATGQRAVKASDTLLTLLNSVLVQRAALAGAVADFIDKATVVNCTFVVPSDKTAATYAANIAYPTGVMFKNCAFFGVVSVSNTAASTTFVTCQTDAALPPTGCTTVAYNTTTGSGFENTADATRDFRIKSTSALKDAGTTDATNAPTDIVGTTRPQSTAYDIGAWEYSAGAPAGTTVDPAVGTVALTGYAPTVAQTLNQALTPGVGSLAITGYAPTIAQPQAISPNVGAVAITGYAPTVTQAINQAVNPGVGTVAITGYAPTIAQTANQAISPNVGSLAITGYAPSVVQASASQNILPSVGSLAITGYAPSVAQSGQTNFGGVPFFHSEYANTYRRKRAEEKEVVADETPAVEPTVTAEPDAVEIEVAIEQVVAPSAISIAKAKIKRELQAELKRQEAAYQALQAKQLEEQFQRQAEEQRNAQLIQELQMLIQKDLEEQDEEEAMLLLM